MRLMRHIYARKLKITDLNNSQNVEVEVVLVFAKFQSMGVPLSHEKTDLSCWLEKRANPRPVTISMVRVPRTVVVAILSRGYWLPPIKCQKNL